MTAKQYKEELLKALYASHSKKNTGAWRFPGSTTIVFGEGNPDADLLLIGEAPGKNEDEQGRPFVGRSGALLNKVLEIANMHRTDIYITNIVKSRPPKNRKPTPLFFPNFH